MKGGDGDAGEGVCDKMRVMLVMLVEVRVCRPGVRGGGKGDSKQC